MFHKVKCDLVPLTPELAARVNGLPGLPGERELKPARIKFFLNHIGDGTYYDRAWTIVKDTKTGKEYRADGQHSSYALRKVATEDPEGFPKERVVTIETIETDNLNEDAAAIFLSFDNAKAVRSNRDIMGIHRAHYPDLLHVEREFLRKLANGVFVAESMRDGLKYPPAERGHYWGDDNLRLFAVWAYQHRDAPGHLLFSQAGIVAAMVEHWRTDPGHCQGFWAPILEAGPDSRVYEDIMPKQAKPKDAQGKAYRAAERVWTKAYAASKPVVKQIGQQAAATA